MSGATEFKPATRIQTSVYNRALAKVSEMAKATISRPLDEVILIQQGVSVESVDALLSSTIFTMSEIEWVIPPRTLSRRKAKGEALTRDESGRWLRAAKVSALAEEVFGEKQKAVQWLHKPRRAFGGESAMQIIQTEAGAKLVEDSLNQLDAGFFA